MTDKTPSSPGGASGAPLQTTEIEVHPQSEQGCLRKTWAFLKRYSPRVTLIKEITNYNAEGNWKEKLGGDIGAGIVVAVMLIPQGMAYAQLAGVPPVYGLYSSIASLIVYSLFATSPQLAVGPVAIVSLLTSAAVADLFPETDNDPGRFLQITFTLAFMVGLLQFLLGLFRAGYIVNFLSHPVLRGFTFSAALIIGFSQVNKLLGYKIERTPYVYIVIYRIFKDIEKANWVVIVLAIENMVLLFGMKYLKRFLANRACARKRPGVQSLVRSIPNALIVVIVNILIVSGADLQDEGVKVVGDIPEGYPSPNNVFTSSFGDDFVKLLPTALIIAVVGFMESISVAKAVALRFGNEVDSNQELVGLGAANIVGSFFNSFPTTGGFSRTMVNADAGARSPLAGLISAVILILTIQFLTPLFTDLPDVTLGALVVFAILKLIEFHTPKHLWHTDKLDFGVYLIALLATFALGIEEGILVGAGISLVRIIKLAAVPHTAVLGPMDDGHTWRNVKRFEEARKNQDPRIRVLRFDSHITFPNVVFFKDKVLSLAKPKPELDPFATVPEALILDCSGVSEVDSSGLDAINELPAFLVKSFNLLQQRRVKFWRNLLRTAGKGKSKTLFTELSPELFSSVERIQEALDAACRKLTPPSIVLTTVRGPVRDRLAKAAAFEEIQKRGGKSCCKKPSDAAPSEPAVDYPDPDAVRIDIPFDDFDEDVENVLKLAEKHLNYLDLNDAFLFVQRALAHGTSVSDSDAKASGVEAKSGGGDVDGNGDDAGNGDGTAEAKENSGAEAEAAQHSQPKESSRHKKRHKVTKKAKGKQYSPAAAGDGAENVQTCA